MHLLSCDHCTNSCALTGSLYLSGACLANEWHLVVTRVFDAPVEQVWKAWFDPSYVMQWWGPEGFLVIWEWPEVCVYHGETFDSQCRSPLKEEHL
jgi:hypothetical protein